MMLKRDMNTVQDAPPKSISTQRITDERNRTMVRMTAANIAVATESRVSGESFDRARCSTMAPRTAPTPKNPSKKPYAIGLLLNSFAAVGKRAQKELVKKIRNAERSSNMRIPGEYRTKQTAADIPPRNVSID